MNEFSGPSDPHEDGLRRLLDDAVSDVEPHGSLDAIRARAGTTHGPRHRSWLWGAGGAVVATAATVAAVTVFAGGPTSAGGADHPFAGQGSNAPAPAAGSTTTKDVLVYYVGRTSHGPRLYREPHEVSADSALRAAVADAVAASPDDPDYRQVWPDGTTVEAARVRTTGGSESVVVDLANSSTSLRDRPTGMSSHMASLAVQQLVHTAQSATGENTPVRLLLDGKRSDTVLGEPTASPVAVDHSPQSEALVWVDTPAEGAQVTTPFTVRGKAATFEANVQWELRQDGQVVDSGYATAKRCCTMSPYSFTVGSLGGSAGDMTLVVHEGQATTEGPAPVRDTRHLTVTGSD